MEYVILLNVVRNVWVFVNYSWLACMCVYYNFVHVNVSNALLWMLASVVIGTMIEGMSFSLYAPPQISIIKPGIP